MRCPSCGSNDIKYWENCYQRIGYYIWSAKDGELNYDGSTNGLGDSFNDVIVKILSTKEQTGGGGEHKSVRV